MWISYSTYCYYYCYWYSYSIASLPANSTGYTQTGADIYSYVYSVVATKDGGHSDFSEGVAPTPPAGAASASGNAAPRVAPRPVPHRVPPTRRP